MNINFNHIRDFLTRTARSSPERKMGNSVDGAGDPKSASETKAPADAGQAVSGAHAASGGDAGDDDVTKKKNSNLKIGKGNDVEVSANDEDGRRNFMNDDETHVSKTNKERESEINEAQELITNKDSSNEKGHVLELDLGKESDSLNGNVTMQVKSDVTESRSSELSCDTDEDLITRGGGGRGEMEGGCNEDEINCNAKDANLCSEGDVGAPSESACGDDSSLDCLLDNSSDRAQLSKTWRDSCTSTTSYTTAVDDDEENRVISDIDLDVGVSDEDEDAMAMTLRSSELRVFGGDENVEEMKVDETEPNGDEPMPSVDEGGNPERREIIEGERREMTALSSYDVDLKEIVSGGDLSRVDEITSDGRVFVPNDRGGSAAGAEEKADNEDTDQEQDFSVGSTEAGMAKFEEERNATEAEGVSDDTHVGENPNVDADDEDEADGDDEEHGETVEETRDDVDNSTAIRATDRSQREIDENLHLPKSNKSVYFDAVACNDDAKDADRMDASGSEAGKEYNDGLVGKEVNILHRHVAAGDTEVSMETGESFGGEDEERKRSSDKDLIHFQVAASKYLSEDDDDDDDDEDEGIRTPVSDDMTPVDELDLTMNDDPACVLIGYKRNLDSSENSIEPRDVLLDDVLDHSDESRSEKQRLDQSDESRVVDVETVDREPDWTVLPTMSTCSGLDTIADSENETEVREKEQEQEWTNDAIGTEDQDESSAAEAEVELLTVTFDNSEPKNGGVDVCDDFDKTVDTKIISGHWSGDEEEQIPATSLEAEHLRKELSRAKLSSVGKTVEELLVQEEIGESPSCEPSLVAEESEEEPEPDYSLSSESDDQAENQKPVKLDEDICDCSAAAGHDDDGKVVPEMTRTIPSPIPDYVVSPVAERAFFPPSTEKQDADWSVLPVAAADDESPAGGDEFEGRCETGPATASYVSPAAKKNDAEDEDLSEESEGRFVRRSSIRPSKRRGGIRRQVKMPPSFSEHPEEEEAASLPAAAVADEDPAGSDPVFETTYFGSEATEVDYGQVPPLTYDRGPISVPVVMKQSERETWTLTGNVELNRSMTSKSEGNENRSNRKMDILRKKKQPMRSYHSEDQFQDEASSTNSPFAETDLTRFEVVMRKEQGGFGITIANENPAIIYRVHENGVAERGGVRSGDKILKVNGTLVSSCSHDDITKMIKSTGAFLQLSLLRPSQSGAPTSETTSFIPPSFIAPDVSDTKRVSRPLQVEEMKAKEVREENYRQTVEMLCHARADYKLLDEEQQRTPNDGTKNKLFHQRQVVVQLSERLDKLHSEITHSPSPSVMQILPDIGTGRHAKSSSFPAEGYDLVPEIIPKDSPFSDPIALKQKPGHLAAFLNYLISIGRPHAMLFSLMTDYYQNGLKESSSSSARRWAYEIYTSFVASNAPLQLNADGRTLAAVDDRIKLTLKGDAKEAELRGVFQPLEKLVRREISTTLNAFWTNRSSTAAQKVIFSDSSLKKSTMDRALESKIIENALWKHFEHCLADEQNDTKQAVAFSLATFFRQVGFSGTKNSTLLENCPTFVSKDKKALKNKMKKHFVHKGHQFSPRQFTTVTHCQICQKIIWGLGHQAYHCSICDLSLHRYCTDKVIDICIGTISKGKDTRRNVLDFIPGRNSRPISAKDDASKSIFHTFLSVVDSDEQKNPVVPSTDRFQEGVDVDRLSVSKAPGSLIRHSRSPSRSIPTTRAIFADDPDLNVDSELPPLTDFISREVYHQLKDKERKKQQIINELFHTERLHVKVLKVMKWVFLEPMREDPTVEQDFISLLFPNLDDVIHVHSGLNKEFINMRREREVIKGDDIARLLVRQFSGDGFHKVCALFCQDQSLALDVLRNKQRKDPKYATLIQECATNSLCKRQELKDFLPREMQRLTKYPLLIDSLRNCTPPNTEEHVALTQALELSKGLLQYVNQVVSDFQNHRKLVNMQRRLDRKSIENSNHHVLQQYKDLDLTTHRLIYDGEVTWRPFRSRPVVVHMVLFDDILVLLQKQDEKLVLRCQMTTVEDRDFMYCPILELTSLMIKDAATDRKAFFIVDSSTPQVYDMLPNSKDEKNKWFQHIKETVDRFQRTHKTDNSKTRPTSKQLVDYSPRRNDVERETKFPKQRLLTSRENKEQTSAERATMCDEITDECVVDTVEGKLNSAKSLQETNSFIAKTMVEKLQLAAKLQNMTVDDDDSCSPEETSLKSSPQDMNSKEIISASLVCVEELIDLAKHNIAPSSDGLLPQDTTVDDNRRKITVPATRLVASSNALQGLMTELTVRVIKQDDEPEAVETGYQMELCDVTERTYEEEDAITTVYEDGGHFGLTASSSNDLVSDRDASISNEFQKDEIIYRGDDDDNDDDDDVRPIVQSEAGRLESVVDRRPNSSPDH